MPLGIGESVGTAYVRIVASGAGLDKSIRDELDKNQSSFETAGEQSGEAWTKGFRSKLKEEFADDKGDTRTVQQWNDHMRDQMAKAARNIQYTDNFFNKNPRWKEFKREAVRNFGDVGKQAVRNLEAEFRDRGNLDGLSQAMENIGDRLAKAGKDLIAQQEAVNRERIKQDKETWDALLQQAYDMDARITRARESEFSTRMHMEMEAIEFRRRMAAETDRLTQETLQKQEAAARETDRLGRIQLKTYQQMSAETTRLGREQVKAFDMMDRDWTKWRRDVDEYHKSLGKLSPQMQRLQNDADRFNDKMGRMFGRGSRNNFLNVLGAFVSGPGRLLSGIFFGASKALATLKENFTKIGPDGTKSLDMVGGLSKVAGSAAIGLAGLAVAVVAVVAVMGPLAALVSGVVAALVALVSTVGFAAAALGGLAFGLTGVLVPAIGIGILAFKNLDKETSKSLDSVGDAFGDLGDKAGEALGPGLRKAVEIFKPSIRELTPLVEGVSEAIGNVAIEFAKMTRSPGWTAFINSLTNYLPGAIESMGRSFANIGLAFGGVFRALQPLMDRFLGWFEDVTARFAEWTGTVEGQETMRNFFKDAGDSAAALGDFLWAAGEALGALLGKGKDTGDTMFSNMADGLEDMTAWLKDPANQDSIRDFFANGKDVAEDLYGILVDLFDLIDKYDTEESREQLDKMFSALSTVIDAFGDLYDAYQLVMDLRPLKLEVILDGDEDAKTRLAAISPAMRLTSFTIDLGLEGFEKINWSSIIPPIKWSDLIPDIKASDIVPDISWDQVLPDIKASDIVPGNIDSRIASMFSGVGRRIVRAVTPDIKWRDLIPRIGWKDLIPKLNWGALIPNFGSWRKYVPTIPWDALIPDLQWSDIIPDVTWSKFIPDIHWGDLIPDISWSDIIPDINWSDFIPDINIDANIDWPSPPGWLSKITASGGVFVGAQTRIIGEAGPEAVVPLARPLSRVHPSVRALSAFAQGKDPTALPSGGSPGRTINVGGITINTPTKDPSAAAQEVVNRLVATGY